MGRGTVTPNKINLQGPQRGGRGKMKSSAFAHPTVVPEPRSPGTKGRRHPIRRGRAPGGAWRETRERAGARIRGGGESSGGSPECKAGRASQGERGAAGSTRWCPVQASALPAPRPLSRAPPPLARRLPHLYLPDPLPSAPPPRPPPPDLARPCGPVLAPLHRFSGCQFQTPGQRCTPLPKGTASCTD